MTIPSWFVIVMGLGTVFIGLICIILLCKILGAICSLTERNSSTSAAPVTTTSAAPVTTTSAAPVASPAASFANRQEVIAAIGAVIAEECGVGVDAIRITSIKRI